MAKQSCVCSYADASFPLPKYKYSIWKKVLKTWKRLFFFSSISQAAKWNWLIFPNPFFGPRKKMRNFSLKVFLFRKEVLAWNSGTARKTFPEPQGYPMFDGIRKLIQQWKAIAQIDTAKAFTKIGHMGFFEPLKIYVLHLNPVNKTLIWWEADDLIYW